MRWFRRFAGRSQRSRPRRRYRSWASDALSIAASDFNSAPAVRVLLSDAILRADETACRGDRDGNREAW